MYISLTPFTSQLCFYLRPKELHNLVNLVKLVSMRTLDRTVHWADLMTQQSPGVTGWKGPPTFSSCICLFYASMSYDWDSSAHVQMSGKTLRVHTKYKKSTKRWGELWLGTVGAPPPATLQVFVESLLGISPVSASWCRQRNSLLCRTWSKKNYYLLSFYPIRGSPLL